MSFLFNRDRYRLGAFFICLYLIWTAKEILFQLYPFPPPIALIAKYVIWIVPVYFYLTRIDQIRHPWCEIGVRNAAVGVKWGVIISSMIVVIEAGLTYFFQGSFHFDLGWRWLTTLLFAIPEEVLFRGFLLQKLSSSLTFIKANLLASLLFVSIHLPIWLVQGGASLPKLIGNGATVFLVGYGLSLLVKRTNSLWSSTIVHTVYNLLIYLRAA